MKKINIPESKITYFGDWGNKKIKACKGNASIHGGKGAGLVNLAQIKWPNERPFKVGVPKGLIVPPGRCHKPIDDIIKIVKDDFLYGLGGKAYVRSTANKEDGKKRSASGVFASVMIKHAGDLKQALEIVYKSATSESAREYFQNEEIEMGIVLHELVEDPSFSGVIENKGEKTLINYNTGYGESIVSAIMTPNTIICKNSKIVSHIGGNIKISEQTQAALLMILQEVKENMPNDDIDTPVDTADIEFAIKGDVYNLVQYRDLTKELYLHNKGSLCEIYPGYVEGILVNANDWMNMSDMHACIAKIKNNNMKVIACIPTGTVQYDTLLSKVDALIIQGGGAASHMANKAGEYKLPCVGGANIKTLSTGYDVIFDTETFAARDKLGNNLLESLFTDNDTAIKEHIKEAQIHVFDTEPGIDAGRMYLKKQCEKNMKADEIDTIEDIVKKNKQNLENMPIRYIEDGYDSCQSHRNISKIVSQIIMLGGIIYEASLLGNEISLAAAKESINSKLVIEEGQIGVLMKMAEKYGSSLDFLFPGVTPSPGYVLGIEEYIKKTLSGELRNSVRHIGGVGGIRHDKDRNHATDFKTFIELKIEEDKRYYPGIGILHILLNHGREDIPLMQKIKKENTYLFEKLLELIDSIKSLEKKDYTDYSILCSCFLPENNISDKIPKEEKIKNKKNIMKAFHSPQRELLSLYQIFDNISHDIEPHIKDIGQTIAYILEETKTIKSFNSPLHLPRTDKLSTLANGLIGQLKNDAGEYIVKYGVGHNGKSLEIQEINTTDGQIAYKMIMYIGERFDGEIVGEKFISNDEVVWQAIKDSGFLKFCFNYLANDTGKN